MRRTWLSGLDVARLRFRHLSPRNSNRQIHHGEDRILRLGQVPWVHELIGDGPGKWAADLRELELHLHIGELRLRLFDLAFRHTDILLAGLVFKQIERPFGDIITGLRLLQVRLARQQITTRDCALLE